MRSRDAGGGSTSRGPRRTRAETRFKPFDPTPRELIERDAESWLPLMHIPGEAETVVVSDQSSVIALSDNLLRVEAPGPFLAHVELQASDEPVGAPEYNVLARRRHRLPVMSTVYEGLGYTLIVIPSLPGAERGSFVLSFL